MIRDSLGDDERDALTRMARAPRGPSLTTIRVGLARLGDAATSTERGIRTIARYEPRKYALVRSSLIRAHNETAELLMTHEDAHDIGWLPAKELRALRERIATLIGILDELHAGHVLAAEEVKLRLTRAVIPATMPLKPTRNGPISDQYYLDPVDGK